MSEPPRVNASIAGGFSHPHSLPELLQRLEPFTRHRLFCKRRPADQFRELPDLTVDRRESLTDHLGKLMSGLLRSAAKSAVAAPGFKGFEAVPDELVGGNA